MGGASSNQLRLAAQGADQSWDIDVLYEDEHLLALNKPPLLLTSPDRYDPNRPNLMKLLHADLARAAPWVRERAGLDYLSNAHRLDFETSGVLLLAKSKAVLVQLADIFGSEKLHKTYVTLVHGEPSQDQFTVDQKISPHPARLGLMRIDPKGGKKSRTEFAVRERFSRYTLLTCRPITGRTHQIRVHASHAGFPLVGDEKYGGRPLLLSRLKPEYRPNPHRRERPLVATTALHAEQLKILHPVTGDEITITAPWPKDLTVAVRYLQRYAAALSARPSLI